MPPFIGRQSYLRQLGEQLEEVQATGEGRLVLVRGRRRIGKSRLVQEFIGARDAPYVYFQARRRPPEQALRDFAGAVAESSLPAAGLVGDGLTFDSWHAALRLIASQATRAAPAVVVIDEIPYLLEHDPDFDTDLQDIWDNHLQRASVLLVVVGSDLSIMEGLTGYRRALYGRPTKELELPPLSPREAGALLGMGSVDGLDAYLVVGGFPLLASSWKRGTSRRAFLKHQLSESSTSLVGNAIRILDAELPRDAQARKVLEAIGQGEMTFANLGRATEIVHDYALNDALKLLQEKRVIVARRPLPFKKNTRYQIVDPYLRFWLRFIGPYIDEIDRGRSDLLLRRIETSWTTFRGLAVEHLIREAVERMLPDPAFGDAGYVGGYWTRSNSVEVDLVGASDPERPPRIAFIGSIKWREDRRFGRRDTGALIARRKDVPRTDDQTKLVGVSRSGFDRSSLDVELGPEEIVGAWPAP